MADPLIALIPQEVGDAAQVTITAGVLATLTTAYADKGYVPRLMYLYCKRHALNLILGPEWQNVTFNQQGYLSESLSDRTKNLLAMRAATEEEIKLTEAQAAANRAPVLTPITQTAPVTQQDGANESVPNVSQPFDANDPSLIGSPYTPPPILVR